MSLPWAAKDMATAEAAVGSSPLNAFDVYLTGAKLSLMPIIRQILRAEILLGLGFFTGCAFGGIMAGISITGPFGSVPFWGGQIALAVLFGIIARGRAERV